MESRTITRRMMVPAALLVVALAASEARSQPRPPGPPMGGPPHMGGPPMGGLPHMGGMMPPPRFGQPPMGGRLPMGGTMGLPGFGQPPMGGPPPGGGKMGLPGLGHLPMGGMTPPPGFNPAGETGGRPGFGAGGPGRSNGAIAGRPVPGGAGGNPAAANNRSGAANSAGAVGNVNSRHAGWYQSGAAAYGNGNALGNGNGNAYGNGSGYRNGNGYRNGSGYGNGWWNNGGRYAAAEAWGYGNGLAAGASGGGYSDGSGGGYSDGSGGGYSDGSGAGYTNPYASESSRAGDYSPPVTAQANAPDAAQSAEAPEQGNQAFDRARAAFKAGDYAAALELTDAALKDVPGDLVVHEFKALVLFARGEYAPAAEVLHAVLAVTPGMSWATLSGLYPDVETYTGQLRALEDRCRQDAKATAARFVLAYHYLVAEHKDAAVAQLKALLADEPGDRVARRLLVSLTATPPTSSGPNQTVSDRDGAAGRSLSVDLVGRWRGDRDGSTFDLSLDGRGRFHWQAARQGKATATVSGAYALSGDTLVLKPEDRSPLSASLTALSPDSFRFKTVGDVPGDPGLVFRRAAMPAAPDRDQRGGPREPLNGAGLE